MRCPRRQQGRAGRRGRIPGAVPRGDYALGDRRPRQLVAALVLGDAGVARHLHELHVGQLREPAAHARDQLLVRLRLPALRQHADGIARSRCRRARAASPPASPASSSARSIAVSSAMLLVPTPRYSLCSRRLPPSTATTPIPIGPGFPEHAPSVHSSSALPSRFTAGAAAFGRALGGFLCAPTQTSSSRPRPRPVPSLPPMADSSSRRIRDTSSPRAPLNPIPAFPTRRRESRHALL